MFASCLSIFCQEVVNIIIIYQPINYWVLCGGHFWCLPTSPVALCVLAGSYGMGPRSIGPINETSLEEIVQLIAINTRVGCNRVGNTTTHVGTQHQKHRQRGKLLSCKVDRGLSILLSVIMTLLESCHVIRELILNYTSNRICEWSD